MSTELLQLIYQIFEICILPLLGIITTYIVKFVRKKNAEIDVNIDNNTLKKYNDILSDIIIKCVLETNQTYTNTLKKQGTFDKEAQEKAFAQTYNNIISILSDDARKYLIEVYDDFNAYLISCIEAEVNKAKVEYEISI